jgi:cytochrome c-type biogenesis protein CcmF
MIPELGHFALILALLLSATQAGFALTGAARGNSVFMTAGISAARGQFIFTGFAFLCLGYAFYANDFSVLYVASNSNSLNSKSGMLAFGGAFFFFMVPSFGANQLHKHE